MEQFISEFCLFSFVSVWFTWRARNPPRIPYASYAKLPKDEFTIEVCLSDIESAQAAVRGGCTSIEVCSDRPQGGVTPSYGLVEELVARYKNTVEIHCLIRPRPGDFDYTDSEFDVMLRDVMRFKAMGVDGIVVGMLSNDGKSIDITRMKVIREVSRGIMLTFHRAFDVLVCSSFQNNKCVESNTRINQVVRGGENEQYVQHDKGKKFEPKSRGNDASDEVVDDDDDDDDVRSIDHHLNTIANNLECDRLLTSGQASSALQGKNTLSSISTSTNNMNTELKIIAAAGISAKDVKELIISTRVDGVHAGSSMCSKVYSVFNQGREGSGRTGVHMGKKPVETLDDGWQYEPNGESWEVTSQTKVGEFCAEISKALVTLKRQKHC